MRHTPFDGSSRPFTIGLKPIAPADWLAGQPPLGPVLAEKAALMGHRWNDVFRARPGSLNAQGEALSLIIDHLHAHQGLRLRVAGPPGVRAITLVETGEQFRETDWAGAPLALASRLLADDLVLMARENGSWVLEAGSVCFPSSWQLQDKFAKPLEQIHDPVPGVNETLGVRINRIFDHMPADRPLIRENWSLSKNPALRQDRDGNSLQGPSTDSGPQGIADLFIRVEHQTVRKLARSGAVLFTIRIEMTPLHTLADHEDRRILAAGLADQLKALTPEQARYKGLAEIRGAIHATLRKWAAQADM